mmetsp:Transcript_27317/g.33345  ORF Transcript_27317/g.33345 Transcript_27317/m.33345 type:complete len:96 (+) Transcript_27317:3748-4035(+)
MQSALGYLTSCSHMIRIRRNSAAGRSQSGIWEHLRACVDLLGTHQRQQAEKQVLVENGIPCSWDVVGKLGGRYSPQSKLGNVGRQGQEAGAPLHL